MGCNPKLHLWGYTEDWQAGTASALPGIPCINPYEQRGSGCRLWSLTHVCGRAHPRGERGGRRRGAHRQQHPRARSPVPPPVLFVGISYLYRASSAPPAPLWVFSILTPCLRTLLQIAMISVRMILCIKIIHFAPLNASALKPRPFRQRDFTFTPMCPCQGQP